MGRAIRKQRTPVTQKLDIKRREKTKFQFFPASLYLGY